MRKAAIMQPTFFPWIGYFDMIDQVDCFVLYDDVQLAKRSWQVRNRIKTAQGEYYLTVPVKKTKARDELLISEATISYEENWMDKHLKTMEAAYKKATHFNAVFSFISEHYAAKHQLLSDFNETFIINTSEKIGIQTEFVRSKELKNINGTKDAKLASICHSISCDEYLSPQGSAVYIETEKPGGKLSEQNIALYYHFYSHPSYTQLWGSFLPYMGIVDLLFNEGFDDSLKIIRKGRQPAVDHVNYRKTYLNTI